MGGWGCPYEARYYCRRLKRDCDPGIPGCVLYGLIEGKERSPEQAKRPRRRGASESPPHTRRRVPDPRE
jgi:hypothetical protein